MIELTQSEREHLSLVVGLEGFQVMRRILEDIVEGEILDNLKKTSPHKKDEVVTNHQLYTAAGTIHNIFIKRLSKEMDKYKKEHDPDRVPEISPDVTEGLFQ